MSTQRPLNSRLIQARIFHSVRSSCRLAMPNYTPDRWFECDVWAVTKAGYGVEYEIKLSRGDYRADATKAHRSKYRRIVEPETGMPRLERIPGNSKHSLLAARSPVGPSRFWFVVPKGMVQPEEVPEWAGLMWASPWFELPTIQQIKRAPILHRQPACQKSIERAFTACYWRMWSYMGVEDNQEQAPSTPTIRSDA